MKTWENAEITEVEFSATEHGAELTEHVDKEWLDNKNALHTQFS